MAKEQHQTLRIEARISADALAMVKRAAEIQGRSVSDLIVNAAHRTIEEPHLIRLSVEEQMRFVDLLLNPPPASPALKRAQQAHVKLIREPSLLH